MTCFIPSQAAKAGFARALTAHAMQHYADAIHITSNVLKVGGAGVFVCLSAPSFTWWRVWAGLWHLAQRCCLHLWP